MKEEQGEGIVLSSLDYHEKERIITLFTPHAGVMSIIVKNIAKTNPILIHLTTPFTRGEFLYQKGKSELYRFIDGTILHLPLPLRKSLKHLQIGGKMLQLIRTSQLPGKSSPLLYYLLLSYLKQLPDFSSPEILWMSFALKLLKHEGVFSLVPTCIKCSLQKARAIKRGESFCLLCSDEESILFSEEEWETLYQLVEAREFLALKNLQIGENLLQKIERYLRTY